MADADNDDSERRSEKRELACFPAYIQVDDEQRTALIRDVSAQGANLLTRARLVEGQCIKLLLYIANAKDAKEAHGKVVRFEVRPMDLPMWPHSAGIQFDEPLVGCETLITELAERQAKLFKTEKP
jgi:hypothetical protein